MMTFWHSHKKLLIAVITVFLVWAFLTLVLRNDTEYFSHNMKGVSGNVVYVNVDGREAVYNPFGVLVTTPENMGSFNYYLPEKNPWKHFVYDRWPWILWGNSEEDTTTTGERIIAYLKDFLFAIKITFIGHDSE